MLLVPEETRERLLAERRPSPASDAAVEVRLKEAGLRTTRQRVVIGRFLFGAPHRHVTADDLFQEICIAGEPLSLATIYNTLHHFSRAGLVRRIGVGGGRTYFDTDTGNHQHFYVKAEDRVIDMPCDRVSVSQLPEPPAGYEIVRVDVIIHLQRLDGGETGTGSNPGIRLNRITTSASGGPDPVRPGCPASHPLFPLPASNSAGSALGAPPGSFPGGAPN